ncbi:MAG: PhnD/SsuA/transferrin family substrate-binding protein, partial [Verrucomicrobiota bacterium]
MKNPRKTITAEISLFFLLCSLLAFESPSEGKEPNASGYTIAIVPQTSAASIEKKWSPLLHYIERQTGIELTLEHYKTIPLFEEGLARGAPDVAYMNPYHALRANEISGYNPIIRDKTNWCTDDLPPTKRGHATGQPKAQLRD